MCVDERGDIALFQPVILGVALYDEQALVVVPRVNLAQIGLRGALEAAARTMLTGIPDVVGEEVLVIQLGIECRIDVCLCMIDIVNIVQHVLPRIGRTAVIAGQGEIVLEEAGMVDLDVPVRVLVAPLPADIVGVAP